MSNYNKLRPWVDIEVCNCKEINSLLLVYIFSNNPIHCFACKNEVDPERLALSEPFVDRIAAWSRVSSALNHLWLSSGEYEAWATAKLRDKQGHVNIEGLAIASKLSSSFPTFYWWFYEEDEATPFLMQCPNCERALAPNTRHAHGQCNVCKIVI